MRPTGCGCYQSRSKPLPLPTACEQPGRCTTHRCGDAGGGSATFEWAPKLPSTSTICTPPDQRLASRIGELDAAAETLEDVVEAASSSTSMTVAAEASSAAASASAAGSPQRLSSESARHREVPEATSSGPASPSSLLPGMQRAASSLPGMLRATSPLLRPSSSSSRLSLSSVLPGDMPPPSASASPLLDLPPILAEQRGTSLQSQQQLDQGRGSSGSISAPLGGSGSSVIIPAPSPLSLLLEWQAQPAQHQQHHWQQQQSPWGCGDPLQTCSSWPSLTLDPETHSAADLSDLTPATTLERLEDDVRLLEGRLRSLPPPAIAGSRPSNTAAPGSVASRSYSGGLLPGTWAGAAPVGPPFFTRDASSPQRGQWVAAEEGGAQSPAVSTSSFGRPRAAHPGPPGRLARDSAVGAKAYVAAAGLAAAAPVRQLSGSAGSHVGRSGLGAWEDLQSLLEGLPQSSLGGTATSLYTAAAGNRGESTPSTTPRRTAILTPAVGSVRPYSTATTRQQHRAAPGGSGDSNGTDGADDGALPEVDDGELAMKDAVFAGLLREVGGCTHRGGWEMEGSVGGTLGSHSHG